MMDVRSSLIAIALVTSATALPSSSLAASSEPDLYVGEYRNIFDGYGITCSSTTAKYDYLSADTPDDIQYDGLFTFDFNTPEGEGRLSGTFSHDVPDGEWHLDYPVTLDSGEIAIVFMNFHFNEGELAGFNNLYVAKKVENGWKILDRGNYILDPTGWNLHCNDCSHLDEIGLTMDDVISIIRSIRGVTTELREVDDGNYAAIGVVSGDGDDIVEKASSKKVIGDRDEEICLTADQPAEFPGGLTELMRWLCANMRYPEEAVKKEIEGRVVVRFVVGKDGTVSNPTIVNSVDPMLDREALRVIRSMPKWIPGENDGEPVAVYYNLPITFRLR